MKLSILASAALCISACPFMAAAASMDDVLARILQLEHTVQSSKEQLREARARIRALEAAVASSPTASSLRGSGEAVGTAGLCGCDTFNTSSVTITGDGAAASLVVGEAATGTINGVNVAELSDTAVRTTGGQTIDGSLAVESLRIGDWSVSQDSEGNLEVTGPTGKLLTTTTAFDAPAVYANAVKPQSASTVELEGDLTVTGTLSAPNESPQVVGLDVGKSGIVVGSATVAAGVDVYGVTTLYGAAETKSTLAAGGELTAPSASLAGSEFSANVATIPTLHVVTATNLVGAFGPSTLVDGEPCPANEYVHDFGGTNPKYRKLCAGVVVVPS